MLAKDDLKGLSGRDKRELLRKLMQQTPTEYPTSHGQEALWFLQQRTPDSCAYNVAACLDIDAELNPICLHKALQTLVSRHPVLRSNYKMTRGRLQQVIADEPRFLWEVESTDSYTVEILDGAVNEDYRKPFNLESDPLCRAHLYRRSAKEWVFLLVVHHIAIDGWSLWQILDELQKLYSAEIAHRKLSLPKPAFSYRDFVIRQRAMLNTSEGKRQLDYWKGELTGDLPILQLPTDKPRPPQQTFNGDGVTWRFSAEFKQEYMRFCRERCITPFVFGLALYFLLLHRQSNQDDILVATPCAGRNNQDFLDVVGYFVNPLPVRVGVDEDSSCVDFLHLVKRKSTAALENQDIPFPVLAEKLNVNRDPCYPVLCQAMFVYQKLKSGGSAIGFDKGYYDWGNLKAKHYPLHQQEGQFDLGLEILEGDDTLSAHWKFNRDIFSHRTIKGIAATFEQLALNVIASPGFSISEIPLVNKAQAQKLKPPPVKQYPVTECLHEKFSKVAHQYPTKTAVTCGKEAITYAELDRRSSTLCQQVLRRGVRAGEPVGISLYRGIELVTALIGVLKAGCCYIPMDPTYPQDRIRYMAKDAGARFVITSSKVPGLDNDAIHRIDIDKPDTPESPPIDSPSQHDTDQLAYILYTSGSTGRPKGVKVSHANIMRLFEATQSLYGFDNSDVWTLFHSYAFDFSVWEMWGALLYGGKLVVVPYESSRSPQDFYQILVDEKVTVLNQTPSAFQQLLPAALKTPENHLRWVIFGGEALDLQSLQPWFTQYGDQNPVLVNMYGITETTVHVTYRVIREKDTLCPQSLIGEPLSDLHIMVLDKHRQVVPLGFPGEIYVGGDGVSQGYLNRKRLTAQRFIDNPVLPGGKLYRTGDLARRVSDKDIAYLGRVDHQVQLRGFRIELGEIESQISMYPDVSAAVVLLREDNPGDKRLVAYYIASKGVAVDRPALPWKKIRQYLVQNLPDYMVPSTGIQLEAFPLTENGKTDLKALPKPEYRGALGMENPRDSVEQRIAVVWAEILGLPRVGIADNFFELGGHSLLAARLTERLQQEFNRNVSVGLLFRFPTVEKLAAQMRRHSNVPWSALIPMQTKGDQPPIFCIPGGAGNALYYQPLARALGQRRPFYGLQAKGLEGDVAPLTSVEAMAQENITALRSVRPCGPYILAGHCFGGIIAYEMAQQLAAAGETVSRLIVMDVPAPFPQHRPPSLQWSDAEWLAYFVGVLEESTGTVASFSKDEVTTLPFDKQLQLCQQYMETAGVIPTASDVRQVTGPLSVFRTNSQTTYHPTVERRFPVTLIRAAEYHPAYDYSAADDSADIATSSLGWRAVADTTLQVRCIPGNHITMLQQPNVQALANAIEDCIAGDIAVNALAAGCGSNNHTLSNQQVKTEAKVHIMKSGT